MGNKRKALTIVLTIGITSYLIYRVHSEASSVELSPGLLLSPYFLLACITGLAGYLLYTTLWYVYLKKRGISFRRTLLATLSGTYLGFSLNSAVGFLVKVRLLGTDYWYTFGIGLLAMATEYISGLIMVAVMARNPIAGILAVILGVTMIFDRVAYYAVYPLFWVMKSVERLDKMYKGWREAKGGSSVLLAILVGVSMVFSNATTLFLVGKSVGVQISYGEAFKGVLYSTFLGGVLGTPGGIGANELGVTIAIGNGAAQIVTAFLYKTLTTYLYALVGAIAFYRVVAAGRPEDY
ncbi:hypothetical membrane protein, conserved [Thermococcus kodakarensis KOD1]|uniref:Hypothetical membrane protein, conserved n=1 Tax=Thermococcus kodakarensis (strain ATCC BAA-918 / JCM 12380 / KOD1) TaxID=69014 RepID=Q5JFH0_THEKO|nr:lysylphosphatidylglycerol synthase domain-containing protein [Thermococcus kodakarensis]WCN28251.1 lysylphosphatidylglycerol synthase domain-containing protein [Thermococcus kodakarensis]WCN30546.1 lysylphosphatidylglycerol synthase domain-containing protein [Thermococcus kodakarensis]BAD84335.1 hypothetical membrane protein, conserved [Thermococcus kodakarensis KOD1]